MSSKLSKVVSRRFILQKQYEGFPKQTDVKIVEEQLSPLKEGEFLAEAVYISVDPYQRAYRNETGNTLLGSQIAKIIDSKNSKFPVGRHVLGEYGWRTHTITNGLAIPPANISATYLVPEFEGISLSLYLGVLGLTGNTAYFGLLDVCDPKPGETIVVSGAAGAVGNHVGQIGKIKNCKVIGIAGSDEKGEWLTTELNFDGFINYKKPGLRESIEKHTPNGVDCYFDNVGGEITDLIFRRMNKRGRISVSGAISAYNNKGNATLALNLYSLIFKQMKIEGIHVTRWEKRFNEAIGQNIKWIQEGKLKYRETVTNGFENTFNAFTDMLEGRNLGKAVVKV